VRLSRSSSRNRFRSYLEKRKQRDAKERVHEHVDDRAEAKRALRAKRSFVGLLRAFISLLVGFRGVVAMSLLTLSVSVLPGL
ncbi:unnamed protein product, partial [Laminaria digitata]